MRPLDKTSQFLIVVALVCGLRLYSQSNPPAPPDTPLITGDHYAVLTSDPDNEPQWWWDKDFRAGLNKQLGVNHYRAVERTAVFNDDQPEFKFLMNDPKRDPSKDWISVGTGKRIIVSQPLPSTPDAILKVAK